MVRSHDADASVVPSGETARQTTGATCPSSTRCGAAEPGDAILPSSPPVTVRPSGVSATAFTALWWKRSTCSAVLRVSDHRIADESKLPETAVRPSGEIASARTAPPCPRNCACAGWISSSKTNATASLVTGGWQPQALDPVFCAGVAHRREEGLHRRSIAAAFDQQEVVVLGSQRQKAEAIHLGHRFDRDAPVGAGLRDGGGNRVV